MRNRKRWIQGTADAKDGEIGGRVLALAMALALALAPALGW